jgi:hypothetical protein
MSTTSTPRIDVAYRIVSGVNDRVQVDWGNPAVSGTPQNVDIAAGLYMSADALGTAIETALSGVWGTPTWTVSVGSNGKFTIAASAGVFTLTWNRSYSLRDWLGYAGTISPATASEEAANVAPGIWLGELPMRDDGIGYTVPTKGWSGRHKRSGAIKHGTERLRLRAAFTLTDSTDHAQYRSVLSLLERGIPATLYRDSTVTSAWAWDNYWGALEIQLDPNSNSSNQPLGMVEDWYSETRVTFHQYSGTSPTVSDFDTAITAPDLGLRYEVRIGGCQQIFLSGSNPKSQLDVNWTAPTDKASQSYVLLPQTFDAAAGIRDIGQEISRRSAESRPGSMTIRLNEDRDGTLLDLFATEKSTGAVSNLEADLDYDTAGTGSVLTVDQSTDWAASGLGWIGRECFYYPTKSATELGAAGNKATRDLFNDPNGTGTTYGDIKYSHNTDRPLGPRIVSDYLRAWFGRWISVRAYVVDIFGRAYDPTFGGTYSSELWRGIISEEPRPADTWDQWQIPARDISALLSTEVGREPITGALLRVPGGAVANQQLGAEGAPAWNHPSYGYKSFYVDEYRNNLTLEISEYTTGNYPNTASNTYTITATVAAGTYSEQDLLAEINDQVATAIDAESWAGPYYALPYFYLTQTGPNDGRIGMSWVGATSPSYDYIATIYFGAEDSIGPLIGFLNTASISTKFAQSGFSISSAPLKLAYISKNASKIPFFYAPSDGKMPDTAPASGYARIGNDETGEIVKYSSISSSSVLAGLYILNVTERGALGTKPQDYSVEWSDDWTVNAEKVQIAFGNGFDAVHVFDALLQLATSTGSGHHGTYDTLLARTAPPLDPNHFDLTAFAAAKADAWEIPGVRALLFKSYSLKDLISSWLAPFGWYIGAFRSGGLYRIAPRQILPALESDTATSIGDTLIDRSDPARYRGGLSRVVNQILIRPVWNVLEEKTTEDLLTLEAADSAEDYSTKKKLEWTLKALDLTYEQAKNEAVSWGQQIFSRYGRPYLVFQLSVGRAGWNIRPGDVVSLTVAGVPTQDGSRGLSSRSAVVIQASYTYEGAAPGADLTVALEQQVKRSTYSPAGLIDQYNAGTPSIRVDTSRFFKAGENAEDHFSAGDKIIVFNGGDVSTRDSLTVQSVSGNVLTINTTLTNASMVTGNTWVMAQNFGAVVAAQQDRAFVASSTAPYELTGSVEGFRYV